MKKITALILFVGLLMSLFTGCHLNRETRQNYRTNQFKSFTFNVETGDRVKVKLDTSDDYNLSSELPFTISCDDETLSQGTFIFVEAYEEYVDAVRSDENAEPLDSGTKDGNEYYFWCYKDSEWNYVIKIKDSNTGVLLGNPVSEESAKECFDRLTFSLEE
jgi:hypothetical protein